MTKNFINLKNFQKENPVVRASELQTARRNFDGNRSSPGRRIRIRRAQPLRRGNDQVNFGYKKSTLKINKGIKQN